MLWAMALILLANWILGLLSGAPLGAWVHLLFLGGGLALTFALLQAAHGRAGSGRRASLEAMDPSGGRRT
jgi:hypothetical protein